MQRRICTKHVVSRNGQAPAIKWLLTFNHLKNARQVIQAIGALKHIFLAKTCFEHVNLPPNEHSASNEKKNMILKQIQNL